MAFRDFHNPVAVCFTPVITPLKSSSPGTHHFGQAVCFRDSVSLLMLFLPCGMSIL